MNVIEIINEDVLKSDDFFKQKFRLVNLIKKLSTPGEKFLDKDGNPVEVRATNDEIKMLKDLLKNNFDPKNPDPKAKAVTSFKVPSVLGGVRLATLTKTAEFGGKVGKSTSGKDDFTKANLGPAVEALKSFAIYAKLVYRNKKEITTDDILKVAKLADSHADTIYAKNPKTGIASTSPTTLAVYSTNVSDANKKVKDRISLKVGLSSGSFQRAVRVSKETDKELWGHLQGILSYVNTESDLGKYSRYFTRNNIPDPLHIKVVGISGAKTDIKTVYQDRKDRGVDANGEPIERVLPNLSMSVKSAGAAWYDQASANYVEGIKKCYTIIGLTEAEAMADIKATKFVEGGKGTSDAEYEARKTANIKMFALMYKRLKARIPKLNDAGEADYIHDFLERMKQSFAGDEKLVYVNFNAKGTYYKIKPQLINKIANVVELDVNHSVSAKAGLPSIYWVDANTGKTIAFLVLSATGTEKRLTYQFNLGKDFVDLMKQADAKEPTDKETSTQAVASEPAAASEPAKAPAMAAPRYNIRANKTTKKEPARGMAPSLEIPNMGNHVLDPDSNLSLAEAVTLSRGQ